MHFKKLGIMAVCAALACTMPAKAQEKKPGAPDSAAMAAMMEKWMEVSTPGEQHKQMNKMAGKWKTVNTMMMDPSKPETTEGTMEASSILDGRFVSYVYKGSVMGMPFEGHGTSGYDKMKKQYVSSWVDNMGTMMMNATGAGSPDGKVITYTGVMDDPMTGARDQKFREVLTWKSDDSFTFEMYSAMLGGQEGKVMTIVHTRVK